MPSVGGSQTIHLFWNIRIPGCLAAACSCSKSLALLTASAMLDCPEQSQTSPINTSLMTSVLSPLIVSVVASFVTARDVNVTLHLPSAPAWTDWVWPATSTFIVSFGAAVPQTGTDCPDCR